MFYTFTNKNTIFFTIIEGDKIIELFVGFFFFRSSYFKQFLFKLKKKYLT